MLDFVAMFSYALFGWRIYLDSWPKEKFSFIISSTVFMYLYSIAYTV